MDSRNNCADIPRQCWRYVPQHIYGGHMAHELAFNGVFGPPLRPESLGFISLADRAIPLLAVNPVIRVAAFTHRLLRVYVRGGCAVFHRVLRGRNGLKVLWVNAGAVPTCMVDDHSLRDGAIDHKPCDTVSSPPPSAKVKGSITIAVQWAIPRMAPIMRDCELPRKSSVLRFSQMHATNSKWSQRLYGTKGGVNGLD